MSHVLLFNGGSSQLASIEYVPATQTYQFWTTRPANVALPLDGGTETATIDVDSQGRMWLATDYAAGTDQIVVYYSDAPYSSWSGPVTLATGINADDIAVVTAMPGGKIGVLWSNQNTQRFGFRTHVDGTDPGDLDGGRDAGVAVGAERGRGDGGRPPARGGGLGRDALRGGQDELRHGRLPEDRAAGAAARRAPGTTSTRWTRRAPGRSCCWTSRRAR